MFCLPDLGLETLDELYENQSSDKIVSRIQIPILSINSEDDPIIDPNVIPIQDIQENENTIHLSVASGGHIEYLSGFFPKFVSLVL